MNFTTGLSKAEARKQAKQLARERAAMLKARDRKRLAALRLQVKDAKQRRRAALARARKLCKVGRARAREQVKALRALERERIKRAVADLKARERNACRSRKERVRFAGGSVEARRRSLVLEELRTQRQIREATQRAIVVAKRSTARERAQESDDSVRSNLPPELRGLWERLKGDFRKPRGRASRTEAFLEWAEANPEEVLRLRSDQADRNVERLVRQQQALERKLKRPSSYAACPTDVATLTAMGLAPTQQAARRQASRLSMPPPF